MWICKPYHARPVSVVSETPRRGRLNRAGRHATPSAWRRLCPQPPPCTLLPNPHDVSGGRRREVAAHHDQPFGLHAFHQRPARRGRLHGVQVEARAHVQCLELGRMMCRVARDNAASTAVEDQHADMARRMTGCGQQLHARENSVVIGDQFQLSRRFQGRMQRVTTGSAVADQCAHSVRLTT